MQIADFSVLSAVAGGMLIGAAAVVLMAFNGRIMGMAGILGGVLDKPRGGEASWRWAFIAGMAVPAIIWGFVSNQSTAMPEFPILWVAAAGFLVGFGSRMGNGCTSGHGICGLARFSKRSTAAVATFMAVAAATVLIVRHGAGG